MHQLWPGTAQERWVLCEMWSRFQRHAIFPPLHFVGYEFLDQVQSQ